MYFVGSRGNIAISTALPSSFCALHCKHQIVHGISLSYFLCLHEASVSGCRDDLTLASSQYDILSCSETLVSDMRHVLELLVPWFDRPVLLCRGRMPRARGMAAYVQDACGAFSQPKFSVWLLQNDVFRVYVVCAQSFPQP